MTNRRTWDAAFDGRVSWARRIQLTLDPARSSSDPFELPVQGDFIHCDNDSTGKVYVRFNGREGNDRLPVAQGTTVSGFPIERLWVDWTQQPGAVVNLWYGLDARMAPRTDELDIDSIKNMPVRDGAQLFYRQTSDGSAGWPESWGQTYTFARGNFIGGVGGSYTVSQIWNPPGSGVYLYVYSLRVSAQANSPIIAVADSTELSALAQSFGLDLRNQNTTASAWWLRGGTQVAIPGGTQMFHVECGAVQDRELIPPGLFVRLVEGRGLAAYLGTTGVTGRFHCVVGQGQGGSPV